MNKKITFFEQILCHCQTNKALTWAEVFAAVFSPPDGAPAGQIPCGAVDWDAAHDGVHTGAVQAGVVTGCEGLHVSVRSHIIVTCCKVNILSVKI